jgi:hypothetical protein
MSQTARSQQSNREHRHKHRVPVLCSIHRILNHGGRRRPVRVGGNTEPWLPCMTSCRPERSQ